MVPLLWSDVLVNNSTAAIAYQFASNTQEASEFLDEHKRLTEMCVRLNAILRRFYRGTRTERSIIGRILEEWGPSNETIEKVWNLLPRSQMKAFLRDLITSKKSRILGDNIEYQRGLIHGDLHLANIMIGSVDVLIDFARSADGPVAVDAAKLISDFLLRMPDMRDSELPTWDSKSGLSAHVLDILRDSFQFDDGDKKLFSLFLILNLAVALQYNDVSKETKAWIRSALSRVVITED